MVGGSASSGNWEYDLTDDLDFDSHTVKVRVMETDHFSNEVFSEWDSLSFTLEPDVAARRF